MIKTRDMAWIAIDKSGLEAIYESRPKRHFLPEEECWMYVDSDSYVEVPRGTCVKLLGRQLTWDDDPVELKEETT